MAATYLLSTALMGLLVLGVAFVVARGRAWHEYQPEFVRKEDVSVGDDSALLTVVFLVLIGLTLGATLFVVGGGNVVLFLGVVAALVVGFLALGVYATARSNGHPHSHAVGEAIITLGAVLLVAVVGWLLATAGA
ncbi:MAG: hypothetical protein BRD23_04265 [Halobacteriales archaeon SW_9_67_25]|jgi:hypothetical protein|nr:MAG: hypothetical protein BRD23_04265 [Halobacteriales archaeon SW_9_67_25]